jgi:hypothetical protein
MGMSTKHLVYSFAKGHLGKYEDWWYLVVNEDGTHNVEHKWDHASTNGGGSSVGEETYSLYEAMTEAPASAVEKIRALLAK